MAVTAIQSELNESVTVSTTVPTEEYNTTLFEASPQSRDSNPEVSKHLADASVYGTVPLDKHDEVERNNDEVNVKVSHVEPDGFHGKSYKDFERSTERNRVLPE